MTPRGQQVKVNSLPVTLASDQGTLAVADNPRKCVAHRTHMSLRKNELIRVCRIGMDMLARFLQINDQIVNRRFFGDHP